MSLGRVVTLRNGLKIPQIGFGTWQSKPGEVERAVAEAIKVGFRHIDCALVYNNQNEVADGIRDAGIDRKELILVSKLWNNSHRPENVEADLDLTLKQLRTDYLDVWLIHWPVAFVPGPALQPINPETGFKHVDKDAPGITATWKEVVRVFKETKKVRAIGVSNFTVGQLEKIIEATGVVPEVNQIECHPCLIQPELFKFCKEKGIAITCYSPLGNNITGKARVIDSPEVQAIAKKMGKTPAQILIAWCAHQGFIVLTKSVTPERIQANFQDIEISDEDFETISAWGRANYSRANAPFEYTPSWDINIFDEPCEQKASMKVW